jgi:hypothetical protein
MQTFLPYKDFDQCAETLDNKRLNKQILESYQILKVLSGQSLQVLGATIQRYSCGRMLKNHYLRIQEP